jgi:hypothetical protein
LLLLLALDDATPAAAAALGWLAEGLAEAAAATGEAEEEEEAPKSPKVMSRLTIPSRSTPSTTTLDAAPAHDDDDDLAGCCWKAPKENGTWKASLSVSSSGATMTCPPR